MSTISGQPQTSSLRTRFCCSSHQRRARSLSTRRSCTARSRTDWQLMGRCSKSLPRGLGDNVLDLKAEALHLVRHLRPDPGVAAREKASGNRNSGTTTLSTRKVYQSGSNTASRRHLVKGPSDQGQPFLSTYLTSGAWADRSRTIFSLPFAWWLSNLGKAIPPGCSGRPGWRRGEDDR